jgi:adenylate cyclase
VEVTSFINELLTPLSEIVIAKNGTIDKYMGDAMMAFWNAPIDDPHHARHACDAAIGMVRGLAAMNDHWRAKAKASNRPFVEVKLGIGINTGNCCVGNLGSNLRFDYSAIGDDVNVASRIEGLTKLYGMAVLMGEATAARIPDRPCLEIDLVRVKGREQPSRLFTPLGTFGLDPSQYPALIASQAMLLDCYRKSDWAGAEAALGKCRGFEIAALDQLYALYEMRIQSYKQSPPPDWDGVFVAVEK